MSMWARTPVYEVDGEAVFGVRKPVVRPDSTDRTLKCDGAHAHRWDLIASEYLGNPELWWVLCELNKVTDPCSGPQIGDVILIPTTTRVTNLLS